MTHPGKPALLLGALQETIARVAPSEHLYRAALTAIMDDVRAIASGHLRAESHLHAWHEIPWTHFRGGIDQLALFCPGNNGAEASLLRYRTGASVPHHLHVGNEHVVILEGSQQDGHGRYERGDSICNPAGTVHSVLSPGGCIVGVFWEKPVRFLAGEQWDPRSPARQDR